MLIDYAEIIVRGGHGGAGVSKKPKGPDGGHGGDGGDVYIKGSSNLDLLNQFSQQDYFIAGNGGIGSRNNKTGLRGTDIEILLPVGTTILDKLSGQTIFDVNHIGDTFLICKGGKGGCGGLVAGNGEKGEEKKLILNLRLIADFGLIGLPNAGKSSLLNELTNADAKTADYPFTTLEPNLGICNGMCLADIPGLIEGASTGKGLGTAFLKHIEKVGFILHCISSETTDVVRDYQTVRKELSEFKRELSEKPEIVILTKTDLIDSKSLDILKKRVKKIDRNIIFTSIHDYQSLEDLKKILKESIIS